VSSSFALKMRNRRALAARWSRFRIVEGEREAMCTRCLEWLPLVEDFFYFSPAMGRYMSDCKFCQNTARVERRRNGKAAQSQAA
jgi:hypothetical protein